MGFIKVMGFEQSLEKTLTKFGKNYSPTLVAVSIATAKGIFRPIFTMSDKKESYETRRYTALREGLTELIAIPVYYLSGKAADKVAEKLAVPKNFMPKDVYESYNAGNRSADIVSEYKNAEELAKINLRKMKVTSAFFGVCLSALLVIPLICSITIKPIMKGIEKKQGAKKAAVKPVREPAVLQKPAVSKNSSFKGAVYPVKYGMKVGGV